MNPFVRRISAVLALAMVITALSLCTGVSTATAKPAKIGAIRNLALTAEAASQGGGYRLSADWDAATGAAAYRVQATIDGSTFAEGKVVDTSWQTKVARQAGTVVTVRVTPVNGQRTGRKETARVTLPDITGPTATYEVTADDLTATVTESGLRDDVSDANQVTRTIDWGDGSGVQAYPAGPVAVHTYAGFGRYLPVVRLTDPTGNTTELHLPAVVLGDTHAPTGAFTAAPQAAWTGHTAVTLTQVSQSDNYTPPEDITRSIDWGDNTVEDWEGETPTHVYDTAGTYPVRVVLTDEAGNTNVVSASTEVTVTDDTIAPTLRLRLPQRRVHRLSTWKQVRGTARDRETGVDHVQVAMIQKRARGWVALKSGRWVRAASKKAAWTRASVRTREVSERGAWRAYVPQRRRGLLVYRSWATDEAGNAGATVVHRQRLTRR